MTRFARTGLTQKHRNTKTQEHIAKTFGVLYHIWYYIVMGLVILVISPFIYMTSRRESDYRKFFRWARIWGKAVLFLMGLRPKVRREVDIDPDRTYVICANHSSELDIMLTLALVPSCFVFIGKTELASLPLFGYFYRRTNILVDRSSVGSKRRAMEAAAAKLESGVGLCLFPEGGIPKIPGLTPFKMGAFKLAVDHQVPILSIAFHDNRKHFPDFYEGGYPGKLRATVLSVEETTGLTGSDLDALRDRTFQRIFEALNHPDIS